MLKPLSRGGTSGPPWPRASSATGPTRQRREPAALRRLGQQEGRIQLGAVRARLNTGAGSRACLRGAGAVGVTDGLVVGAADGEPARGVGAEHRSPCAEGEVALRVVDADVVRDRHRAGVAVVGEPVMAVLVGDAVPDDVVDRDVVAAELVAVAVAVGVHGAVGEGAVAVGEGVLDGHRADGAGVGLGVEVPAVVDVVVGDVVPEDVPGAGGQLRGEAVGVLAVGVGVVVRLGVLEEIRPSCSPVSRLYAVTARSTTLLLPPTQIPLSPACCTVRP